MEKLKYEDAFVMEIVVDKINEIIENLQAIENDLHSRIDALWKYQRVKKDEMEKRLRETEELLGVNSKRVDKNGNKTS